MLIRHIFTFFLLFITLNTISQDTIDVVEKTIKISGLSDETEYYAFAEGDKVIVNVLVEKKELKDITISEYPGTVKFANHTFDKIENKVLNIARNSIYVFNYNNTSLGGRTVNIKIQRVPKTEKTKFYNTNVKWVNKVDTTYSAKENFILASSDTSFVDVINSKVRVFSQTNLDNPNKTLVDFILPANTIKWTYWIGVGEEGDRAFKKDQVAFTKQASRLVGSINPLAGLAVGLISMTHSNVGENVKYSFLPTYDDARKFIGGQSYMQFKTGDVVTDFGLMNFANKNNEKYYIGLENDNTTQGIEVGVKVLAVVVNNKYNRVIENVPSYRNVSVPVCEE